jgi:class 3 adenylate cyclase/CHASE2 domain-containing sensor protein
VKNFIAKIRQTTRLVFLVWIIIPILLIDAFYIGALIPERVSRNFRILESKWYDFLIRQSSKELIDQKRELDQQIHDKTFQVNSAGFNHAYDTLALESKTSKDIAIVTIDEKTLTLLGEWPIRRSHYAKLMQKLIVEGHARGVVFDIVFAEQSDQLPIQRLTQLKSQVRTQLKTSIDEAIAELNYDHHLEKTMYEHRLKIVAGYTTLQDEEAAVKDFSKLYFPSRLQKYKTKHLDVNFFNNIAKVKGGVFNYSKLMNNLFFRGFFSVPIDPLDGLVRDLHLFTRYPVRFKDRWGETTEEELQLFGSLDLEAYAMIHGSLNPPELDAGLLRLTSVKRKILNASVRQDIKENLLKNIPSISELSDLQKSYLKRLVQNSEFMGEDIYRGLTKTLTQYSLGALTWSTNPDEGFLLELLYSEWELQNELLSDLPPETRAEILSPSRGNSISKHLGALKIAHDNLGKNLLRLLKIEILSPIHFTLSLLHSFSNPEKIKILEFFRKGLNLNFEFIQKTFQIENLTDYKPSVSMQTNSKVGIFYYGIPDSYPQFSFVDILQKPRFSGRYLDYKTPEMSLREAVENRIIYVGPTAAGINDWRNTPIYKQLDGVEVHAHALDNLRNGHQILRSPNNPVLEVLLMIALGIILPILLVGLKAAFGALLIVFLVVSYYFLCSNAFLNQYSYFYFIPPFLQCLATYLFQTSYSYVQEERERRKTRKAFQHYVNASVVEAVLHNPDLLSLGGEREELSVLFSDVRGFTTISEKLDPHTLVCLMNEYLTEMTDLVLESNGTLDKFIGDAVMAFWGAPIPIEDHAKRAVETALAMNRRLAEIRPDLQERFDVEMLIGVGINTGPMVVGNMGSTSRFDYTVIGDAVNLGARLEGQTKNYGTDLILSESTYNLVKDWTATRFLDLIAVKGKKEPVRIYECVGIKSEESQERLKGLREFEEAIEAYYLGRKFQEGIEVFKTLKKYRNGKDLACDLYIERCQNFIKFPPNDEWNGVFVATSK